jgi:pullulanase/glycogen debranching enzyme
MRVQMLGAAINAFSQGVAYFHAGMDILRSKSMDGNSYDSGDWFNRLDWRYADNYFGSGAPPKGDNGNNYGLIKPLLANPDIKPTATEIATARDMFRDLLKLRASSTMFRLPSAPDIKARLKFFNTGSTQSPTLLVGHLDGVGYPGAGFQELLYFVNVDKIAHDLLLTSEKGKPYVLHPVHLARDAADKRPALQGRFESETGRFGVPARTALVYVVR